MPSSPQREPAAGPRRQDLSRRHDRQPEHSLGRRQERRRPGRLPPGMDPRHGELRDGPASGRRHSHATARLDLPGHHPARRRRLLPEFLDRRRALTGLAFNSTKCRFPIILAWRLWKADALGEFRSLHHGDRGPAVISSEKVRRRRRIAGKRPGGYSPSTLASNIAALICAAEFIEARGDKHTAEFVRTLRRLS